MKFNTPKQVLRTVLVQVMLLIAIVPVLGALGFVPKVDALNSYCWGPHITYSTAPVTNSTSMTIYTSGFYCDYSTVSQHDYEYPYLLVSRTDSTFQNGNLWSTWFNIPGMVRNGIGNASFNMDLTLNGSSPLAQGNNTLYMEIVVCDQNQAQLFANPPYPNNGKAPYPHYIGKNGFCTYVYSQTTGTANIFYDTQTPTAGGYVNNWCQAPGASMQVIDGGSSDPAPSSGWGTGAGTWYYVNNGTGANSGWTNAASWSSAAPTAVGYNYYTVGEYIRDAAYNQSAEAYMGYYVDNATPTAAWVTPSATSTSATTVNLTFGATEGGCNYIGNVAISNGGGTMYLGSYQTSYSNWDFTNAAYGGNSAQGPHIIYVSFQEAGTSNWVQVYTTVTYDSVGPTGTTTLSIGSAAYTNAAFTDTWAIGDPTSGLKDAWTYNWTKPTTDGLGNCTGATSGANWLSAAASGTVGSGFTNGSCIQYQTQGHDNANNFGATPASQWVMFDNVAPSFGAFSAPTAPVFQSTTSYTFGWSAATDNASGVASYNLQAQTGPVMAGACSTTTWIPLGSVVNQTSTTYTLSGMANGACYRLLVSPVDRATNTPSSSTSAAILVDWHTPNAPSAPSLAVSSDTCAILSRCPVFGGLTSIHNGLVFTGTAEAGATVTLYYGSYSDTGTASGLGGYSIPTTHDLAGGVYVVTATATTAAGVTGSASSGYTVVINRTCPA